VLECLQPRAHPVLSTGTDGDARPIYHDTGVPSQEWSRPHRFRGDAACPSNYFTGDDESNPRRRSLAAVLGSMPNVGKDEDFARHQVNSRP
jgi:hypothetical protein